MRIHFLFNCKKSHIRNSSGYVVEFELQKKLTLDFYLPITCGFQVEV